MKKNIIWIVLVMITYHILFKSPIPGQVMMADEYVFTYGETYERVWNTYNELPTKVKDMFEDNGYRIYVVSSIDNDEYILGQTRFMPRTILIKNSSPFVERTTFHEFGHMLDDELAITFISKSDEFLDIYNSEKGNFKVDNNYDYFVSSHLEYFASAFSEYMIRPARLQHNTPRTYEFIERCLQ